MLDNDDVLLYVVSAAREMSWGRFKKDFDSLYQRRLSHAGTASTSINQLRWHSIQLLDALGHCDVVFNQGEGKIYAAPPALARLPLRGIPRAVLCGARGPETISCLRRVCRAFGRRCTVDVQAQRSAHIFVPRRVVVEAESNEMLAEIANNLQINYREAPSAWALLHLSGSLHEYLEGRAWSLTQELNWPRRDFDTACLQFRAYYESMGDVRLSSYDDPVRSVHVQVLWRGPVGAEVDRDWGRYGVLQWDNKHILVYDPREWTLAVPRSVPLPRLLARALTLCSGFAPQVLEKTHVVVESPEQFCFDTFTGIPSSFAQAVASKLGQVLVQRRLRI